MSAAIALETVRSPEGLAPIAREWDALVLAMPRPSPFLLHAWVSEWWRHFGDGHELSVAVARRDGRVVGIAPLYIEHGKGLRVARFLGGYESALADLLLDPSEPSSTRADLLAEVRRTRFDVADLFGLPTRSQLADVPGLTLVERVEAPVLLMPDGWEAAYTSKTSSKKRNLHRRRLRQLGELGTVEFVYGRTSEELAPLLEDAFRLHDLRWQGRRDGSSFGTPAGRVFHRAALERLAGDGVLRIMLMRVGGEPAAFHYFFALDGTMVVHRLGFDPELGRHSPGLVATLETLRLASEDGMRRVEFLGGGERYKLELADHLEPLSQGIGLARGPRGLFVYRERLALIALRKRLKRSEWLHKLYLNGLRSAHAAGE